MNIIKIPALLAVVCLLSSCADWLDVPPKDRMLEKDLFATEEGTNIALNGLYRDIVDRSLYGGHLGMTTIEMLAHFYDFPLDTYQNPHLGDRVSLGLYDYNDQVVESCFGPIWEKAYATILSINVFIANVENSSVVPEARRNIMLGEAYGLRAMLHFDLLRLFGPIYKDNPDAESIPYNRSAAVVLRTYGTASEVLELVLGDIKTASDYLSADNIVTGNTVMDDQAAVDALSAGEKAVKAYRNFRMNYYAVQLLRARVLLLRGDDEEAAELADRIIAAAIDRNRPSEQDVKAKPFAWTPFNTNIASSQNYVFYDEVIFGVDNPDLPNQWKCYFQNSTNDDYLAAESNLLRNMYDIGDIAFSRIADVRKLQWAVSSTEMGSIGSPEPYYFSRKYNNYSYTTPLAVKLRNMQALMRISELYYIKAEACLNRDDVPGAIDAINAVLGRRGLQVSTGDYSSQTQLPLDATREEAEFMLEREYYREFFLEGQTFFFLKRNKKDRVITGNTIAGFGTNGYITFAELGRTPEDVYVVPVPPAESNF